MMRPGGVSALRVYAALDRPYREEGDVAYLGFFGHTRGSTRPDRDGGAVNGPSRDSGGNPSVCHAHVWPKLKAPMGGGIPSISEALRKPDCENEKRGRDKCHGG